MAPVDTVVFPSDYFNPSAVDPDLQAEYEAVNDAWNAVSYTSKIDTIERNGKGSSQDIERKRANKTSCRRKGTGETGAV